jgi:exonuclease III
MKLVTWNGEFGKATRAWPSLVQRLGVDVALLQEVFKPSSSFRFLWEPVPGYRWGTAVVARRGRLNAIHLAGYEGWVVGGKLLGAATVPLFVFSVHAPSSSKSARRASYVNEVVSIVRRIRNHNQVPTHAQLIIGGDFNFTSLGERLPSDAIATSAAERRALSAIAEMGLVPVWQACHPAKPLPQTIRWSRNRTKPYHCDGFLARPTLAADALCGVIVSPTIEKSSDHNAVAAWLA